MLILRLLSALRKLAGIYHPPTRKRRPFAQYKLQRRPTQALRGGTYGMGTQRQWVEASQDWSRGTWAT